MPRDAHHFDRIVSSHGDAVIVVCGCGWVSAPARRYPAEAALAGHVRRATTSARPRRDLALAS